MSMKSLITGWVAATAMFALAGCGSLTYTFKGTPKAPEMDMTIIAEVKKDITLTQLKITGEHLAPPERLAGSGKAFVVWAKDEKGKWSRVANLKYNEGDRKATLEGATVPQLSFDLMITVESDAAPDAPAGDVLVTQHVN